MSTIIVKGPTKTALFFESTYGSDKSYTPYPEFQNFGGWDKSANLIKPIQYIKATNAVETSAVQWALESIVLAYEHGLITDQQSFVQCFESPGDIAEFCGAVRDYEYWLNERIFWCFHNILGIPEERMLTFADLADTLEFDRDLVEQE